MRRKVFFPVLILTVVVSAVMIIGRVQAASDLFSEMNLFVQVYQIIQAKYIEKVSPNVIMRGAIEGMIESLDDSHSRWLDAEEWAEWNVQKEGEFGGLGMTVGMRNGRATIVSTFENTPASDTGLKARDVIESIDGLTTADMTLDAVVSRLRGQAGTTVTIEIQRVGTPEIIEFTLTRTIIRLPNVESRLLSQQVGYLRIIGFTNENTAHDIEQALRQLKDEGANSLILDVRDNPGGLLSQAIDVADQFLSSGTIVSVRGRDESDSTIFPAHPQGEGLDLPLLVLINEGSASASEIVAGSVKDNRRGILLGERTFGKGTVQNAIPLAGSGALWLTTAKYYTPSGVCIEGEGIEPNIEIAPQYPSAEDQEILRTVRNSDVLVEFLITHPQWSEELLPALLEELAEQGIVVNRDLLVRVLREQDTNKENDVLNDHQLVQALNLLIALPAIHDTVSLE